MDIHEDKKFKFADEFIDNREFIKAIDLYNELINDKKIQGANELARIYARKGYCYYHTKEYLSAIDNFSHAISLKPNVPTTLFYRARCYEHINKLEEAISDYKESAILKPESDVFLNLGLIYKWLNNYNEALKAFEKARSLKVDDILIPVLIENTEKIINNCKRIQIENKRRVTKKTAVNKKSFFWSPLKNVGPFCFFSSISKYKENYNLSSIYIPDKLRDWTLFETDLQGMVLFVKNEKIIHICCKELLIFKNINIIGLGIHAMEKLLEVNIPEPEIIYIDESSENNYKVYDIIGMGLQLWVNNDKVETAICEG